MYPAVLMVVAAALYRLLVPVLHIPWNFAPLMAIAFCGALYLPRRNALIIPLAALFISDIGLNIYYGVSIFTAQMLVSYLCYTLAALAGLFLKPRKTTSLIAGATLLNSVIFYLFTNSISWLDNPAYARTASGWFQALTVGQAGFPPTWIFFRNSLVSDVIFTVAFVLVMETVRRPVTTNSPLTQQG